MASIKKIELKGRTVYRLRYMKLDGKPGCETFTLERDAKRRKAEVETDTARGTLIDPKAGRTRVSQLGTDLLATKTDRRNHEWYEMMLRLHVYPKWANQPIVGVTHLEVTKWVADLRSTRGPDTVRGAFRALHEVVKLALSGRLIGFDPMEGVKGLPPVNRREMLFLTGPQTELLANEIEDAFPGYGWGILVRFTTYSGLRAGEVGGLKVKHLDLLGRRVNVVKALKSYGADGKPKKGKVRWVDIPKTICDELADYLSATDKGPEDRVWTGEGGGPLNHKWFYTHRYKVTVARLSAAGYLPTYEYPTDDGDMATLTLRFHDLRHTCVALLIADGNNVYEIAEHLGHTNIQTTINTYGHILPNVHTKIRESLERTLEAARATPIAKSRVMLM